MTVIYQYMILRLVPDSLAGERLNVGVFLFRKDTHWFRAKVSTRLGRVSHIFADLNLDEIRRVSHALGRYANGLGKNWEGELPTFSMEKGMESFIYQIYPQNNNHLQWSEMAAFLGEEDEEVELEKLYERIIGRFEKEPPKNKSLKAVQAARKPYWPYFEEFGIARKFEPHVFEYANSKVKFKHTLSKGILLAVEELPLTIIDNEAANDRIIKWAGHVRGLAKAHASLKLNFVTPVGASNELVEKAKSLLTERINGLAVNVVTPKEAAAFAQRVKQEMEESENG